MSVLNDVIGFLVGVGLSFAFFSLHKKIKLEKEFLNNLSDEKILSYFDLGEELSSIVLISRINAENDRKLWFSSPFIEGRLSGMISAKKLFAKYVTYFEDYKGVKIPQKVRVFFLPQVV